MQKLLNFLKKLAHPIPSSALLCAAGVSFIVIPSALLDVVILVIGALIAALGISIITACAVESERGLGLVRYGGIFRGSLILLLGVSLMIMRSGVSSWVCTVLGILLTLYGIFKLSRPGRIVIDRSAGWYVETVVLVVIIILGVAIAIFPEYPKVTAGVAMLVFGLKMLSDAIIKITKSRGNTPPRVKKSRKIKEDYYTTDFVDKSDK